MDVSSYRPISLLPIISKVLKKLIFKKINKDLNPQDWIPNHQFGFRQAHSTVQQCHRITDVINKTMENQQYSKAAFLDVGQAFDKVWHPGPCSKSNDFYPQDTITCWNLTSMNANSKRISIVKYQPVLSSIPVYPKEVSLVLFSIHYTYLTYQHSRERLQTHLRTTQQPMQTLR